LDDGRAGKVRFPALIQLPLVGEQIQHYRIVGQLGVGGMGEITT